MRIFNPIRAKHLKRFFKTGKGQYGEGDVFFGLTVPESRLLAKKYHNLSFPEIKTLLKSVVHEERLIALLILVANFKKADEINRKKIYEFYLKHTKFINNWDLVDLSAASIVGGYLKDKPRKILERLAGSAWLWDRRLAIIATHRFIYDGHAHL